jgi:hypothetical protein
VILAVCSAIVGAACVIASGRRLAWAIAPMGLDPRLVHKALEGKGAPAVVDALRRELARSDESDRKPRFAKDREFFAAFDEPQGQARDAGLNEQLMELEGRADRWSRVPRVCASIGTSAGFLLASIALVEGLGLPDGEEGTGAAAIQGAMFSALGALSLGIAATSFCVAVHVRAARVSRERRQAIDELVERLERLRSMSDGEPMSDAKEQSA